jgi:hypothetical protein
MEKEWEKMGKNGKIMGKNEGLTFSLDEPNCALDWVLCVELCSVLNYVMCWIVCWIFEELCEECEKIFEELCVGFSRNCVLDFRGIVWGVWKDFRGIVCWIFEELCEECLFRSSWLLRSHTPQHTIF